jgi:hypothetical protein
MMRQEAMIAFARESLGLPQSVSIALAPLNKRGSDRSYFRLSWPPEGSAVLVRYDPVRPENACWADIALFLAGLGVPVPRLLRHDPETCLVLMEDLGDTDLASFANIDWETRGALYRKTLLAAHRLHSFPPAEFPSGRIKLMDAFGPDLYRWERGYFMEHFVRGVCGIDLPATLAAGLEGELSGLAERLAACPQCLVHRDLQSQNVMVRGGEPVLIDFQGMRLGCAFYDLGALLCDPYVGIPEERREELLSFYYGLSGTERDRAAFQDAFWEASAQRLMQALGAFGFLGLKKDLPAFLHHIPSGLANLILATTRAGSLPILHDLAALCRQALP